MTPQRRRGDWARIFQTEGSASARAQAGGRLGFTERRGCCGREEMQGKRRVQGEGQQGARPLRGCGVKGSKEPDHSGFAATVRTWAFMGTVSHQSAGKNKYRGTS